MGLVLFIVGSVSYFLFLHWYWDRKKIITLSEFKTRVRQSNLWSAIPIVLYAAWIMSMILAGVSSVDLATASWLEVGMCVGYSLARYSRSLLQIEKNWTGS